MVDAILSALLIVGIACAPRRPDDTLKTRLAELKRLLNAAGASR